MNLTNSSILVTGGTGSFGHAVVRRIIESNINPRQVRILSRDEKKQDDMRKHFNSDLLKFYLGDVRDRASMEPAFYGVDYIFHAAALKQVPSCEFFPLEAVRTNVMGTANMLELAIRHQVKKVVCLSTDKAVYPINAMGMSKAMMEKVATAQVRSESHNTVVCCTRYGNVMASRGSVIPLFCEQIRAGKPLTITNPDMTRFMMNLDEAVDLVFYAFEHANAGDMLVQKSPAATVQQIARCLKKLLGRPDHEELAIGTRHGEKLYETLVTREEMQKAESLTRYYKVPADTRDLNYGKYFDDGKDIDNVEEYHSHNAERLSDAELMAKLEEISFVQEAKAELGL